MVIEKAANCRHNKKKQTQNILAPVGNPCLHPGAMFHILCWCRPILSRRSCVDEDQSHLIKHVQRCLPYLRDLSNLHNISPVPNPEHCIEFHSIVCMIWRSMYWLNIPLVLCPTIHRKTLLVKYLCGPHRQWMHPMRQSHSTVALGSVTQCISEANLPWDGKFSVWAGRAVLSF